MSATFTSPSVVVPAWLPDQQQTVTMPCLSDVSTLVKSVVPNVADWCILDILDERGELQRHVVAHADPSKSPIAEQLGRLRFGREWPLAQAKDEEGRAVLRATTPPFLGETSLGEGEWSAAHREALRQIDARSCVVAPLMVGERVLGSLTFITAGARRGFGYDDYPAIREVSARVAAWVDECLKQRRALEWIHGFSELLDAILDGVIAIDARGQVVLANESAATILGVSRQELLRPFAELPRFLSLLSVDGEEQTKEMVGRALEGASVAPVEREVVDREGKKRTFRVSVAPIRAPNAVFGALVTFAEVTAQRARTEAESARLKDEFFARVSHELRAPLSAISMWVHVLRDCDGGDRAAALAAIEHSTKVQARLIEDLLDEVRAQSGTLRVNLEPTDPRAPVEAALAAMRPLAEKKSLRVEAHLEPGIGTVRGDLRRLQQVVHNLLTNAIEFTPPGGKIEVRLKREGHTARISVTDTGEGIAPEFLPHVFVPFRQADPSTTRRHGGLGLGLSIVRELVERHGGTVSAQSAGVGKGATFTVALPLQTEVGPSTTPKTDGPSAPTTIENVRVLVVEDDDLTRDGLALLLERYGAVVTTAASASEARLCMQRAQPHILLCDIAMPGEDGNALIASLRAKENGSRLPAVALTAHSGPEDRARSLAAGFDLHMTKPVDVDELVRVIGRVARRG